MLSKFHKTTSEFWRRTPGNQKGSPLSLKGGKSQGQGSLVSCCLWGHTELDMTEVAQQQQQQQDKIKKIRRETKD